MKVISSIISYKQQRFIEKGAMPQKYVRVPKPNEISSLLILADLQSKEDADSIHSWMNQFRKQNKKCFMQALAYITHGFEGNVQESLYFQVFSARELNWWKAPKAQLLDRVNHKVYDVMINLDRSDAFPLTYLSHVQSARIRCGLNGAAYGSQQYSIILNPLKSESHKHLLDRFFDIFKTF